MIQLTNSPVEINNNVKLDNVAIANALQLEGRTTSLYFWPILYCACAQTNINRLPIEILTSPLDSATPIS